MNDVLFRQRRLVVAAPHPDDAAFACGGLLATAAARGLEIVIVTFCTRTFYVYGNRDGDVDAATAMRRREEEAYAALLGAGCRLVYLDYLDAIVRRGTLDAVFDVSRDDAADAAMKGEIAAHLRMALTAGEPAALLLPLGLGRHVDHRVVRDGGLAGAADAAAAVILYEDLPYAIDYTEAEIRAHVAAIAPAARPVDVTTADFEAVKARGMACYRSQDEDGSVAALTLKCGRRIAPDGGAERYWVMR
ncbi:MAG: PIG-L family deacetylase [Magnetospirillum sp.]|nr:PIG-L family deacetylase [Magnetospirillum sp.]